ncbi:hypothetical protein BJ878DRAFT_425212 [Calycina marina]|uniref:GST N-terminal domain-containing protein n=1 Tax=Calycina marina TaxID=1763456 RepID=A0A9P7YZU0_9HELO|nr:hypothetical protein BJ878DRAFT_425212 [Calycina marina]
MEAEAHSFPQHQHQNPYRPLQPHQTHLVHHGNGGHHQHLQSVQTGLGDLIDDSEHLGFHPDLRLQDAGHGGSYGFSSERSHAVMGGQMDVSVQNVQSRVGNVNVNVGGSVQHAPQHAPQQQQHHGGTFGILTTAPIQHGVIERLQEEEMFGAGAGQNGGASGGGGKGKGHLNTKIVPDPPNLDDWRQKLFAVDEVITLSQDEFETYFPHVDNVYSHRSTQEYKRKPFRSHYWDCRLKGRPPGTPKSDDPNKKKRRRTARERDLCDVKIKITEYFPGAIQTTGFDSEGGHQDPSQGNGFFTQGPMQMPGGQFGTGFMQNSSGISVQHPGANGAPYYTVQRVNGNGGNGKGDGVAGPHKHTLEDSDKIKKNSVQRLMLKKDKEDKKTQKTYHKKATGAAAATVRKHFKGHELQLFGSCFCPFVQRVWIALEAKNLQYQYIEVDPYKKPQALLEVNPRGLVPGLRHGDWGCGESIILMEYLEDLSLGQVHLLPQNNPQLRAHCRLWSDHIDRKIVPLFYSILQAQEFDKQAKHTTELQDEISKIVEAADPEGPFFLGAYLGYVDVIFAPWMLRFTRVLKVYREWPDAMEGTRWWRWMQAVEGNEHVRNTTSGDELYVDSYERYSQNRPGTSELADAINSGFSRP